MKVKLLPGCAAALALAAADQVYSVAIVLHDGERAAAKRAVLRGGFSDGEVGVLDVSRPSTNSSYRSDCCGRKRAIAGRGSG